MDVLGLDIDIIVFQQSTRRCAWSSAWVCKNKVEHSQNMKTCIYLQFFKAGQPSARTRFFQHYNNNVVLFLFFIFLLLWILNIKEFQQTICRRAWVLHIKVIFQESIRPTTDFKCFICLKCPNSQCNHSKKDTLIKHLTVLNSCQSMAHHKLSTRSFVRVRPIGFGEFQNVVKTFKYQSEQTSIGEEIQHLRIHRDRVLLYQELDLGDIASTSYIGY